MQRIVKRFLLHKQRESDDVKESDFDELKQDLQMVRFEMLNDIKKSEEETLKYISLIHNGVAIIGDEILKDVEDVALTSKFKEFKQYDNELNYSLDAADNDNNSYLDRFSNSSSLDDGIGNVSNEKNLIKRSMPNLATTKDIKLNDEHSLSADSLNDMTFENATGYFNGMSNSKSEPNIIQMSTSFNVELTKKISLSDLDVINEEDEVSGSTSNDNSKI